MNRHLCRALLPCLLILPLAMSSAHAQLTTPDLISVNANGAATDTIPLKMPAGQAGVVPNLALTYSSQRGDGPLGIGWALSGLSMIAPCPSTMAQDGAIRGIQYDANDKLCLDGSRLILVSGTYGAPGSEYRTELDQFARIQFLANTKPGNYFSVTTKAGQVWEYGNTTDSRLVNIASNTVLAYAIDQISDADGNYMTFSYDSNMAGSALNIMGIDYADNKNIGTPYRQRVNFNWESKPTANNAGFVSQYQAGIDFSSRRRISSIVTQSRVVDSTSTTGYSYANVTTYTLSYDTEPTSYRSRLISVKQCDSGTTCMPPNKITYGMQGAPTFGVEFRSPVLDWGLASSRAWIDFDGDGRADFCRVIGSAGNYQLACTLSTGSGFGQTVTSGTIDPGQDAGRAWVDIDGSGHPAFCRVIGSTNLVDSKVACTLTTGSDFGATITSSVIDWGDINGRAWVDMNGDGRADYCRVVGQAGAWKPACAVSSGTGFTDVIGSNTIDAGQSVGRAWVDMNGDGRADYCRVAGQSGAWKLACAVSSGTDFNDVATTVSGSMTQGTQLWGDVNGDGKADYCTVTGSSGSYSMQCQFSSGVGFLSGYNFTLSNQAAIPTGQWIDINGDGQADYCWLAGSTNLKDSTVSCVLSTTAGFTSVSLNVNTVFTSPVLDWGNASGRQWVTVDGTRTPSFCRVTGTTNLVDSRVTCTPVQASLNAVSSITNGLGRVTSVTYKPITDPSVYTKDATASYPSRDQQLPVYVVASIASSNGIGGTITTNFTYGGLKTDLAGRGVAGPNDGAGGSLIQNYLYGGARADASGRSSLGFRWMEAVRVDTGRVSHTEFRQDWPYIGMSASIVSKLSGSGNNGVLSQTSNTYACIDPSTGTACSTGLGKRYFPYVSQSVKSAWDLNGAALPGTTSSSQYDAWGNPTTVTTSTTDGFTTTTVNTYNNDAVNWYIGQRTQSVVTKTSP